MANHSESLLLDGIAKVGSSFEDAEMRYQEHPISRRLEEFQYAVAPEWEMKKTSDQRTVKLKSLTLTAAGNGTARDHAHTGSFGDSQSQTMTWATKSEKFKVSLKEMDRNEFNPAEVMARNIKAACINLAAAVETAAAAQLATWKTQSNPASNYNNSALGAWNDASYVWEINQDDKDYAFDTIHSVLRQSKYKNGADLFADAIMYREASRIKNAGASNDINLQWQLAGLKMAESINLTPGAYIGLGYAIPAGTAAMMTWIPKANRNGAKMGIYEYYTITCPITGRQVAVHTYTSGADNSGNGGETQDVNVEFELSYDISFNRALLSSGANDSSIHAFAIKA